VTPGAVSGFNVEQALAERGLGRMTQDEIDANWDAIAAKVKRSTDEQLRNNPGGMSDVDIARWRRLADHPVLPKRVSDWWYTSVEVTA
jgi:hypothetical protein